MKRIKLSVSYITLSVVLLAAGCSKDPRPDHNPDGSGASDPTCKLTIILPDLDNTTRTRAFGSGDENTLQSIDIFAFEVHDDGVTETYAYHRSSNSVSDITDNRKLFTVSLKQSRISERYRFVMLANVSNEIAALDAADMFVEGMDKYDLLELIEFNSPAVWNSTGPMPAYLPMWGETADTYIISGSSNGTSLGTVKMFHSLARIDIGLNYNITDQEFKGMPNFEIKSLVVHNGNVKGLAAPSKEQQNKMLLPAAVATEPSLPAGVTVNTTETAYTAGANAHGFIREIYVSEYDNKNLSSAGDDNLFCVLVGGYYTAPGEAPNTSVETWYRVDFYDNTASGLPFDNRYDVLRNHLYRINITSVDGPGYEDPDEAAKSRAMHMKAQVIPWNMYRSDNEIGDVTLSVSEVDFQLSYHRHMADMWQYYPTNNRFTVHTSSPDGFTVKIKDAAGNNFGAGEQWLSVYPGDPDEWVDGVEMQILTNSPHVNLVDTDPRRARIYLTAGTWEYVLYVSQASVTCGWDGTFLPQQIGKRAEPYDTYAYAASVTGITRCWMLENLEEVRPEHNDNEYVLRFTPEDAIGISGTFFAAKKALAGVNYCPDGWMVPPVYGFDAIFSNEELLPYYNLPLSDLPDHIRIWFDISQGGGIEAYDHTQGDFIPGQNNGTVVYPDSDITNLDNLYVAHWLEIPVMEDPGAPEPELLSFSIRPQGYYVSYVTYLNPSHTDEYFPLRCVRVDK